jgi:DegT/DnrJ/EryC1/StrS aminotransferase family
VEAAITPRTKAILPIHLYGLMCDMRALKAITDRHGWHLIEDAVHCIEGMRDGVRPGELSDVACFSFYATKNLTCGEGGAIAANDDALMERKVVFMHVNNTFAGCRLEDLTDSVRFALLAPSGHWPASVQKTGRLVSLTERPQLESTGVLY